MAKLTAASINEMDKVLNEKRKIYILGDKEVIINKKFKDSSMDTIAYEYLAIFELVNNQSNPDEEILKGLGALVPLLMLREFSDVPSIPKKRPTNNSEILKLVNIAMKLYDNGVLGAVLNAFDQDEVQKVYAKVDVTSKQVGVIMGELAIKSAVSQPEDEPSETVNE